MTLTDASYTNSLDGALVFAVVLIRVINQSIGGERYLRDNLRRHNGLFTSVSRVGVVIQWIISVMKTCQRM